jgi:hypothetical protein
MLDTYSWHVESLGNGMVIQELMPLRTYQVLWKGLAKACALLGCK